MEILDFKQFQTGLPGKKLEGYALINSVNVSETKKGQPFLVGKLFVKGEIEFKVWNNSRAFEQLSGGVQGEGIYIVSGEINLFNGSRDLILNQATLDENSRLGKVDFLKSIYDGDRMYEALCTLLKKSVSENWYKVFELVMSGREEAFRTEYAAVNHHDNVPSGLVAHTYKVCRIVKVMGMYSEIVNYCGMDLLMVGSALHDIGKAYEYNMGAMSKRGKILSHRVIGLEIFSKLEEEIVELIGQEGFDLLISIIVGHHGEYEEKPRTVAAYVVHLCDMIESNLQSINQELGTALELDGLKEIRYAGMRLR